MRKALIGIVLCALGCRSIMDVDGAQKAAERFLAALSRGDMPGAYAMVAPELRAQADEAAFEKLMQASSLVSAHFGPASWHGTSGNTAHFTATVETPEGPMTLDLILLHREARWEVARIRSPGYPWPSLAPMTDELRRRLPPEAELQSLVAAVIRAHKKAVVDGDRRDLEALAVHAGRGAPATPPLPGGLTSILASAVDLPPALVAAEVSGATRFRVDAIYPTQPKLQLRLTFENLGGGWKLGYLRVRTVP